MSKAEVSYYDWQLTFKENSSSSKPILKEFSENTNSLGIKDSAFKEYLAEWKKKNNL